MTLRPLAWSALVLALAATNPAHADLKLSPEQTGKVVGMLARQGFTSWQQIEFDDGKIEVDDAVHDNGKPFDLTLDPETLEIIERKAE